ncbi:hypothetical protein [Candidatus Nanohalococcus occultus]|uniref:hypothetical protein n=1 Tax=Candidatus Nanohalococcus occultus TaxID=2978047 RepID=UPI0039DF6618
MKLDKTLFQNIIAIEAGVLAGLLGTAAYLDPETASALYVFEFLGAAMATLITSYGIYKMNDIT